MTAVPPQEPGRPRLGHLDVLRGIATLGILPVNFPVYAFVAESLPAAVAATPASGALDAFVTVFFERKFITIFAFLFGAGLALQRRSHEARAAAGRVHPGWAERMARRLATLLVFGALHAVLLWHGDIVATYALVATAGALLALWRSVTGLVWTGAILASTSIVFTLGLAGLAALADVAVPRPGDAPGAGGDPLAPWPQFIGACFRSVLGDDAAFETAVFGAGSYARASALRAATWIVHVPLVLALYGLRLLGLFALGMAVVRSGLADAPRDRAPLLRRTAIVGLAAGLPLAFLAWLAADPVVASRKLAADALQDFAALFVSAGYASLIVLWATRPSRPLAANAFAAVGRTAFSNYVLQSVVMTFVLTGTGLGLHGRLTYVQVLAIVPCAWTLELAVSTLWTRRFAQGPVEWAWRRVAFLGVPREARGDG